MAGLNTGQRTIVGFAMATQEGFRIKVWDDEVEGGRTVAEAVRYVKARLRTARS